ncbi:MAG: efflux RND transporter permease subunit [Pseudomonadota bacterium]|nr:efflux RND transporter permease subunit [Pseudomonadota bacterium]
MSGGAGISALQRHSKTIWMAIVIATIAGLFAAAHLPVALFPHIDYPRVVVAIDAGERDATQMSAQITRPAEVALRAIPGVREIRSTTSRGSAELSLGFDWGEDMVAATQATQGALAGIQPDLPTGTRFSVRRSDPTIFPVFGLSLTSKLRSQTALRQIALLKLLPLLSSLPGVAGVDVLGGGDPELAVDVDPAKMQALGLSIGDVTTALGSANTVAAVGRIEDRHRLYLALVDSRIATADALAATPIKAAVTPGAGPGAGVVLLGQIATITPGTAPKWTTVTANGARAVLVNIRQTPTADAVALVAAVNERLKTAHLGADIAVSPFYDQSELVTGAADAVRDAILVGAVLAGIVLFFFLRSARLMLMTALLLPAVLAATCAVLATLGMSFNMMTLGGMAAAVGLVVDDAVVMLEHLMRRLEEAQDGARPSMLMAAREMARALFGSTMATIVVFMPLALVSGVTGGFFKALAVTMTAALAISLLYARYVLPLAAERWLTLKDAAAAEKAGPAMAAVGRRFEWLARRMFARPGLFVGLVALVLATAGILSFVNLQSGFMPKMDEGGFILDYKAKPGAALSDTNVLLCQAEAIIRATPEVASYSRRTGYQLGGGLTEADEGDFFVRLKGGSRRDIEEVMKDIRDRVAAQVPGLTIETAQLMEDLIGDLTAVPQPIEVKLFGDNDAELAASARKVADAIGGIKGVVEVQDGLRVAGDAISITVDRGAAALAGLDPDAISRQLANAVDGSVATTIYRGETHIDVRVRLPAALRDRAMALRQLPLRTSDGRLVTLGEVARITIAAGQRQITRENLSPFIPVTARLEGLDLGSGMTQVKAAVARLGLPTTVRVEYGGLYAQQQQSFRDLTEVFLAALMLAALLLTWLFERWTYTAATIATVLLAAASAMVGLWVTGTELDISALMGLTMAVGMITELAVFLLAEIDPAAPLTAAVLMEAARARLRPILMSALIAILTLMPLALGISRGAGLQRPLATAIIAGLAVGAPLVLIVLPGMLLVMRRRRPLSEGAHNDEAIGK